MRDDSTPTAGDLSPGPRRRAAERDTDPHINLAGELAVERTELALERTHLAWIRTVFTLLTAGVALDKGMEIIHQARLLTGEAWVQHGHVAGIVLTVAGTILLLLVTIAYVQRFRALRRLRGGPGAVLTPGLLASGLVLLVGALVSYLLITSG
jgi:putative membrane protein